MIINEFDSPVLLVKMQSNDKRAYWVEIDEHTDSIMESLNIPKGFDILDSFTCCGYKVTKKESLEDLKDIRNFLKKWCGKVEKNALQRALTLYRLYDAHIFLQGCLYIKINK